MSTTARDFLKSAVAVRKRLIRTNRSYKTGTGIQTTIMLAEDLLNRYPSEATVRAWLTKHRDRVRDLIPAQGPTDKRIITLMELTA
jgi:hypothetical protein